MLRHPPDILITTPESLFLLLTSQARAGLATYRERFPDGILEREAKVLQRRAAEMPARASGR